MSNNLTKIAVIGAGISGLTVAQLLKDKADVVVFEKENRPGGLIKCDRVEGALYHRTGGHVFNSKNEKVLDWFWRFFDKDKDFTKALRNAVISMPDGKTVGYPIENHVYQLSDDVIKNFIADIQNMIQSTGPEPRNFEEFLKQRFGNTLYGLYFQPYNEKIWNKGLSGVPLSWLEGKLPMPTVAEMLYNNFVHAKEMQMVHSSFYYPKQGGSQFLADTLAKGLNIRYDAGVERMRYVQDGWLIGEEQFDAVVFCGNIKQLPQSVEGVDLEPFRNGIDALQYHGTTSVLCEVGTNSYSWIYLPDHAYRAHRIICTGNFSTSNNPSGKSTATVEFTDFIGKEEIEENLQLMPFSPKYIAHHFEPFTYPIQDRDTKELVAGVKKSLAPHRMYLCSRFADWEYYNMDAAMAAAMRLVLSDPIFPISDKLNPTVLV